MKRYNNLWQKIVSTENIELAIKEASRGKKKMHSVCKVLKNPDKVALKISQQLQDGTWTPKPYHDTHSINDGIQLKKREIVCPEFEREQIVHHAVMRVVSRDVFLKKMYEYSCGSVPKRGDKKAIDYLQKMIRKYPKKTKYYVQLDVKKFFDSVKHSLVFKVLRTTIKDKQTLLLLSKILRNNRVRKENGEFIKRGLPIGFFTSPWLANILLTPLDHWLKNEKRISVVVRFIDDIILMDGNKRKLRNACFEYKDRLVREFKLNLKYEIQVHELNIRPFEFIGYQFNRGKTIIRSPCFLRAIRSIRRIGRKDRITSYDSARALCYVDRFNRADMRLAFYKYIRPQINVKTCRNCIARKARKQNAVAKKRKFDETY